MLITNTNNLPAPLVMAVTRHPRENTPGRISVSELIQPPQIRALSRLHDAELTEDASERIWALLGTLLHGILERNARGLKNTISEEALEADFLGWQVVGHYDLSEMVLDGELLTDWKLTSVWSVKDGVKAEWEQQLNCYAELIRRAGRAVSQLQIVAIGRDWSKNKARFDATYPQEQVKVLSVSLWTSEEATEFIEERVRLHQKAESGTWADCTDEERWARPTQWALMKKTQKKAIKLFDKKADAHERLLSMIKGAYEVVERPGESVRCESYCSVASFCPQKARLNAAQA
ncbi:MAG: hypothetical protein AABN95_07980 [Acidobacteriota bacterium]